MAGARVCGNVCESAQAAVEAGCDFVLVCNEADAADLQEGQAGVLAKVVSDWNAMDADCRKILKDFLGTAIAAVN